MGYSVTNWTTAKLDNLKIPVAKLYEHERSDWHPERIQNEENTVYEIGDSGYILGTLSEDGSILSVLEIEAYGEGSRTALNWIINPALKASTGELIATRIWEGGDSFDVLRVKDGELSETEVSEEAMVKAMIGGT